MPDNHLHLEGSTIYVGKAVTTRILDELQHFMGDYKYIADYFEFGKVRDVYDAVDLIDIMLKRIKELADFDFVEERIELLRNIYFQLGKFSDNLVWEYEVHRYFHPDEIFDFITEVKDVVLKIYGREEE